MNNIPTHKPEIAMYSENFDNYAYLSEETQNRPESITKLLESYDHMFDFNLTKRNYFKKLRQIYKLDSGRLFHKNWNKLLLSSQIKSVQALFENRSEIIYEVIQENGEDILIYRRRDPEDPTIRIISAEDCFPIILNAHRETMHGNEASIRNKTEKDYLYPTFCIPLVLNSCNVCKEVSGRYNATECTTMQTDKSTWKFLTHKIKRARNFNYIFIYTEVHTAFTLIRPFTKLTPEEVGTELYKIHRIFGTPQKILTSRNRMNFLLKTLKLFSAFELDSIRVGVSTNDLFDISCVIEALDKWSDETESKNWAIGAAVVQWKINTSRRVIKYSTNGPILSGVPYNLFYGMDGSLNSPTSDLVAEQLGIKFRNYVKLEVLGHNSEVCDRIVNLGSDESDTTNPVCCVCNKEFVLYTCQSCKKFVHFECGVILDVKIDNCVICDIVCLGCNK